MIKKLVKDKLKQRGFYQELLQENQELRSELKRTRYLSEYNWFVAPGHYYSPLIAEGDIDAKRLVDLEKPKLREVELPGIALNKTKQLALLSDLTRKYMDEMPDFTNRNHTRYHYGNDQFGMADATFLYLMLRHLKPKRVIEVGSGWTSALMLDVNNQDEKHAADLTFIDPHPERLYKALKPEDKKHCKIITKNVQDVEPKFFKQLEAGDILFIDDSHVSKSSSDVNYLFAEIVPRLKKGVIVHVHDIPYPFEYPRQWILNDRRNWNEAYVVRAYLTHNPTFDITLWHSFLLLTAKKELDHILPSMEGLGTSLWLTKIA